MAKTDSSRQLDDGTAGHVRLEDVARIAGVSPITVSRAVRTPDKVSAKTLDRIQAAIRECGYVPNLVAGSLASSRTKLVAALILNIENAFSAVTIRGLSDTLRENGLHLVVGSTQRHSHEEEELIRAYLGQRPCGLVLHETSHTGGVRALLARARIPVVEIGDLSRNPIDSVVSFSNYKASKAMTLFLAKRGYRRIALVTSPSNSRSEERRRGYQAALRTVGLPISKRLMVEAISQVSHGASAIVDLLSLDPDVDAVLFTSHATAIGALLECQKRGWHVPSRVAIAGFDDDDLARQITPSLTTVRIPRYDIGRCAAEVLLSRMGNFAPRPRRIDVGFEILPRESA